MDVGRSRMLGKPDNGRPKTGLAGTMGCGMGFPMSIQQLLITEVSQQPEPLLREVWHYLNFLKARSKDEAAAGNVVRPGFGSVPGIELAEDFDAPLEAFADYRP
jgi:hypothetical protein